MAEKDHMEHWEALTDEQQATLRAHIREGREGHGDDSVIFLVGFLAVGLMVLVNDQTNDFLLAILCGALVVAAYIVGMVEMKVIALRILRKEINALEKETGD